jgi:hypothetical protein
MTVSSNLDTFLNKRVVDYSTKDGIQNPEQFVYRIRISYDDFDNGITVLTLFDDFVKGPKAATVKEIIFGAFDYESSNSTESIVNKLVEYKGILKNLKAIFIGDITYEENEISWINQSNVGPVLEAYPELEHFQVRGGTDLSFGKIEHSNLKTLIIETGGMPPNVVTEVSNAHLPNLQRLDLWLGSDNYGFDSTIDDFASIISGKSFPNLVHLGLMNSEMQNEIAIAIAQSPILDQLGELDMSMGNMDDKGGEAILNSEGMKKLKSINLRHHYLSNDMMSKLSERFPDINLGEQEQADEDDDRYIEVSE